MNSYDVIIVGAGTAGIPAALEAGARGLSVALIEAADDVGGTLHLSTASISAAGTSIQARNNIEDNADAHYADYLRINHGTGEPKLVRRWIDDAANTIEWLLSLGWQANGDTAVFAPEHDLYTIPRTYRSLGLGVELAAVFKRALEKAIAEGAKIDVRTNTRFTGLLTQGDTVTGIRATHNDQTFELTAKSVILTTGGFTGSEEKWHEFHGMSPLRYGLDTAKGDGIDAVRAIGGTTWYEDFVLPAFGGTREIGGPPSSWIRSLTLPAMRQPWEVYVNLDGKRFMPEDEPQIFKRELAIRDQRDWAFWMVYDEGVRETAPPLMRMEPEELEAKFAGPDAEFVRGDTIEALAEAMGVPVGNLQHSIKLYNQGQKVGSDMLGRQHLPMALEKGPFYAVRHYGFTISSYPGVRVNDDLQVVKADGTPIGGLYAAGEATGIGWLGLGFLSGSIVSSAITFGRQLGASV